MNPQTLEQAMQIFDSIEDEAKNIKNVKVVISAPFVYLPKLAKKQSEIELCGQDCHWENKGAYTGEISAEMLKNIGCEYVILGHSERRTYFNETDAIIEKKLKAGIDAKLKPILCIGETEEQKKLGKTSGILVSELTRALQQLIVDHMIIAYEPVWAIGTGKACSPEIAKKNLNIIKTALINLQVKTSSVLYGGSINPKNAKDFIKAGFDGLLVGKSSLNSQEFNHILKLFA